MADNYYNAYFFFFFFSLHSFNVSYSVLWTERNGVKVHKELDGVTQNRQVEQRVATFIFSIILHRPNSKFSHCLFVCVTYETMPWKEATKLWWKTTCLGPNPSLVESGYVLTPRPLLSILSIQPSIPILLRSTCCKHTDASPTGTKLGSEELPPISTTCSRLLKSCGGESSPQKPQRPIPAPVLIHSGCFLCRPPINYTAFINTELMNGLCWRGGVNTAPACTHVATY